MDGKPTIAFVTGGYSGEAVVSYASAITIENNIDRDRYNVYKIDVTPGGWMFTSAGTQSQVDMNNFSIRENGKTISFDAVFIGIHGTPGEDGKLQGYFEMLNIPYTSCDASTSSLTFNKRYTVAVAAFAGISVAKSVHLFNHDVPTTDEILKQVSLPVFVKPNNGGSSIGISKVTEEAGLAEALSLAFQEDTQVLVEEVINGPELTIGVFRNKGSIITLPITEVKSKKAFFDYEAKYTAGMSEEITPALIEESIAEKIRTTAKKIYEIFNCRGVVRIDFIYNEAKQQPYMLEINTVPGQSEASIVPKQVQAFGWTLKEFYSALIDDVLERK